ncbi:MAG: GNAT family N-acetyltransferase [Candidatus Woesearchaeota archaeon]
MNIKIKRAIPKDYGTLCFFRYLLREHESHMDKDTDMSPARIKRSADYIKKYLKKKDNAYFIAYLNGMPIGYLHVTIDKKKGERIGYLSELYVLSAYRSMGIGKKFMEVHDKFLQKNNIVKSTLTTDSCRKNNRTIHFYTELGYNKDKCIKKDLHLIKTYSLPSA